MLLELYKDNAIVGRQLRLLSRKNSTTYKSWIAPRIVPFLVWSLPLGLVSLEVMGNQTPDFSRLLLGSLGVSGTFSILCLSIRGVQATASSITQEREQRTFESMTSTLMAPWEIVFGKLWVATAPLLQECLETLPLAGILALAGGNPILLPVLFLLQVVTTLFSTTLGMMISYLTRNSQESARVGGLLVLAWSLLPMLISSVVDAATKAHLHIASVSPLGVWQLDHLSKADFVGQSVVLASVAGLIVLLIYLQRRAMTERTR